MQLFSRLRIPLAYLLLMVFSLVALPRELWHNGEHQSVSIQDENSAQTHLTVTQEQCPICAIHIAPFIAHIHWEGQFEIIVNQIHTPSLYTTQEFTISSTLRLRGPPSGIIYFSSQFHSQTITDVDWLSVYEGVSRMHDCTSFLDYFRLDRIS